MYVIYEKSYISRPTGTVEDETYVWQSSSLDNLVDFLKVRRGFLTTKRSMYSAIKSKKPIKNIYYIYKVREK